MATTTVTSLGSLADPVFRSAFRGELIAPEDEAYDEARKVYNGMIDRRPGLIARCVDTADVIAAVGLAREHKLLVSVRGGGHNAGGLGVADGALCIDLSAMRGVHVDTQDRTVLVEGGARWGDVDHATHPFGLAVPSGIISTTGVGGLTLGGGLGHLSRAHGLAIDSLLEVGMVLADGSYVTASEHERPDLFWAVRGGGGNFGVVTSFRFLAHPVRTVVAGPMLWEMDRAAEIRRAWDAFIGAAPRELNGFFAFLTVPPADPFPAELWLKKMCGVVWCCNGSEDRANALLAPFRERRPALDGVMPMPFPALQSAFDELYPPGDQWYWKADFVDGLSDAAIERHVSWGEKLPSLQSTMHLYPIDGAVHDVAGDATAFSFRGTRYAQVIVGVDPDPARAPDLVSWARGYFDAVHRYSAGGAYVNFLMDDEGAERVHATYGENYARLEDVKRRYDPANFFRVNQNIPPRA
jgi:FAD/FMN-containing dehydrogenase